MIELSRTAAAAIALFCGLWLAIAAWVTFVGIQRLQAARALRDGHDRTHSLLRSSPASLLIVARGSVVDVSPGLAELLGLDRPPDLLAEVVSILVAEDGQALTSAVEAAMRGGRSFSQPVRLQETGHVFLVHGAPAPAPHPVGSVLMWFVDATETEQSMEVLRNEVGRFSAALDSLSAMIEAAPFPMWHRGPDLELTMVNSAYVAAVEAQNALEVVQQGIELVDESERMTALEQATMVRESRQPITRTVPATIAGARRMVRVVEVPLGDAGLAGYAIDVEDREQAKADLARFVRAQRDMLDRLSAGVAQFARDRSLSFYNQPFVRLFSLEPDWLADGPEFDRVIDRMREGGNLPEVRDFPDWKQEKRGWFTAGLDADEEEWLLPGGKHLRVVAQPLPDGGLLVIFEDRTEQIQLASARDTLLRVRTATFDNLFEAVGVFASDGRLHLWNNRFRDLWQFEEEALAAHPRVDSLTQHISKKLKNPAHASMMRELVRSATVERKQRKGRVSLTDGRDFEFAAVPLPDGNALFTMLDITDARVIETALRERNEALEEADRMKTAFVSNMSYELRTPLTSIAGFAEMLGQGYAGELPATAAEYVTAILESVSRLGALIDNVLDLTQSDSGSLLLAEDEVDVQGLCHEAAGDFQETADRKHVQFVVEVDSSVGSVTGDTRRLRQALDNILGNAFAYTDEGGRVLLRAAGTEETAEVTVTDTGRGISLTDQARVFDRFHRATTGTRGEEAALGLGLPLARQFIEAHGGSIALDSKIGVGTTVTIRLPREQSSA
jgi:signal transduction histidine kinase